MGIDIMDITGLQGGHAQGFAHSHKGTLALRRRGGLMESVASITVTAQATQGCMPRQAADEAVSMTR